MLTRFTELSLRQILLLWAGPVGYVLLAHRLLTLTGDGPLGIVAQVFLANGVLLLLIGVRRAYVARRKLRATVREG